MNIILSGTSGQPIYDQIAEQLRAQIISGALPPDAPLPSMRLLARDLNVSLITTKRAYEELERGGYIRTVAGKGSFVAQLDGAQVRTAQLSEIEALFRAAVRRARLCGIADETLSALLEQISKEDSP